uniref:NADH dehydrogenase subunit 6 n=1 Tax=Opistholeptus burmanus TaxID=2813440 RepID=A0A8T9ZWI1_9HEMI|nr:NADH dehydrogenase subunit 6 [Opistholeptus burmanus]
MKLMLSLMLTNTFIFMWMNHPLTITISIIMQTLLVSITTVMNSSNSWFSYIIVISMLSGMLVLFMYMSNVASNEKFNSSVKLFMLSLMLLITLLLTIETMEIYPINSMPGNENISLMNLFNKNNYMVTMIMILYLFITMIVISYIVNIQEGPLRAKF